MKNTPVLKQKLKVAARDINFILTRFDTYEDINDPNFKNDLKHFKGSLSNFIHAHIDEAIALNGNPKIQEGLSSEASREGGSYE